MLGMLLLISWLFAVTCCIYAPLGIWVYTRVFQVKDWMDYKLLSMKEFLDQHPV